MDLGCVLKNSKYASMEVVILGFWMWMMALVCNRLSKWHYEFTSKIGDEMA